MRIKTNPDRSDEYLRRLDERFLLNKDTFRSLDVQGLRGESRHAIKYHLSHLPAFCYSPQSQCTRASLGNAIEALAASNMARNNLGKRRISEKCLAEGGTWLERTLGSLTLSNVSVAAKESTKDWLIDQKEGIFILGLQA